ncbi:FAD binding domain-containing protein [Winogradskyella forsetii]|uniref:FAD binding domain-containing protein n=1 Tax=Winogradskyella forsetii TaxID=2686077 RepID=UPI0015BA5091|nr:FAD binding domain-containing protein [Winogradskyella forsetii]
MINFILNNRTIKTPENSGMTLLDFVRYQQRLTGTKIGCREGDCGACTVLVGTLKANGIIEYQSITSCISPLGNAHGKHIVTVEGTNLKNKLTTAQEAMKANYATQCGFCTPGFVVALTGFALSNSEKNYSNALDAISGNICRCTGYKSIERAAHQVVEKLEGKKAESFSWLIDNGFIPEYFETIPERLKDLEFKDLHQPKGQYVSGGTDLYVQQADKLIANSVHLIAEKEYLKGITIENEICTIGTNSTVSDLWNHSELNNYFPNLKKHLKLVSSEQIRNMASFGGNLVNASPIGDMTIFFLALNSDITIIDKNQNERTVALKNFYQDYKTFDLREGELIKAIKFKLPTNQSYFNFEKVCKRTHLDIASVNSAIHVSIENNTISESHVAVGGVAAIPKYLHKTSKFLIGKSLTSETILEANDSLQNEISPISDVRGTSDYKRLLARQLFFAHFTELFPEQFTLNHFVQHA